MSCEKCPNSFLIKPLENWYGKEYVQWLVENEDAEFTCMQCDNSESKFKEFSEKSEKIFKELAKYPEKKAAEEKENTRRLEKEKEISRRTLPNNEIAANSSENEPIKTGRQFEFDVGPTDGPTQDFRVVTTQNQ